MSSQKWPCHYWNLGVIKKVFYADENLPYDPKANQINWYDRECFLLPIPEETHASKMYMVPATDSAMSFNFFQTPGCQDDFNYIPLQLYDASQPPQQIYVPTPVAITKIIRPKFPFKKYIQTKRKTTSTCSIEEGWENTKTDFKEQEEESNLRTNPPTIFEIITSSYVYITFLVVIFVQFSVLERDLEYHNYMRFITRNDYSASYLAGLTEISPPITFLCLWTFLIKCRNTSLNLKQCFSIILFTSILLLITNGMILFPACYTQFVSIQIWIIVKIFSNAFCNMTFTILFGSSTAYYLVAVSHFIRAATCFAWPWWNTAAATLLSRVVARAQLAAILSALPAITASFLCLLVTNSFNTYTCNALMCAIPLAPAVNLQPQH